MLEITGAVRKDGRTVCKACGCPLPENPFPNYSWSRGDFSYEERRCICGAQITVLRLPEEARHA